MATYGWMTGTPFEDKKAIVFNNSGSMAAPGRMGYVSDIITHESKGNIRSDIYINDASGRMKLVAENYTVYGTTRSEMTYSSLTPILPIPNGEDGWNPYVLAGVIDLYTEVHIIDDGDDTFAAVMRSLMLLKANKEPSYMHDVNIHIIRTPAEAGRLEARYESILENMKDEGLNVTAHFHFTS
jgi:hypothetical protein